MTEADLRHLEDTSAPISDAERAQAAAEIRRLRMLVGNPQTDECEHDASIETSEADAVEVP